MNEIENTVTGRIEACDERRPRDGTLRWSCCAETPEATGVSKPSHIGQFLPMPLEKIRIHTIYAENNDFFSVRF